eukprot:7765234-Pyramimonas_sp.AAC.1
MTHLVLPNRQDFKTGGILDLHRTFVEHHEFEEHHDLKHAAVDQLLYDAEEGLVGGPLPQDDVCSQSSQCPAIRNPVDTEVIGQHCSRPLAAVTARLHRMIQYSHNFWIQPGAILPNLISEDQAFQPNCESLRRRVADAGESELSGRLFCQSRRSLRQLQLVASRSGSAGLQGKGPRDV